MKLSLVMVGGSASPACQAKYACNGSVLKLTALFVNNTFEYDKSSGQLKDAESFAAQKAIFSNSLAALLAIRAMRSFSHSSWDSSLHRSSGFGNT